jgi:hypothetical protein
LPRPPNPNDRADRAELVVAVGADGHVVLIAWGGVDGDAAESVTSREAENVLPLAAGRAPPAVWPVLPWIGTKTWFVRKSAATEWLWTSLTPTTPGVLSAKK